MKKYFKASIIVVAVSSALFSCNPENVTEGDINPEQFEEKAVDGKINVRQTL